MTSSWRHLAIVLALVCFQAEAEESARPSRPPGPPPSSGSFDSSDSPDPNMRPRSGGSGSEAFGARAESAGSGSDASRRPVDPEVLDKKKDRLVAKIAKSKCPKGSAEGDVDTDPILKKLKDKYPDLMNDRDAAEEIESAVEDRVDQCIANGGKDPQQPGDPAALHPFAETAIAKVMRYRAITGRQYCDQSDKRDCIEQHARPIPRIQAHAMHGVGLV